jgi:hypothetical protein
MRSSCCDKTGVTAGRFRTNVYTKKRRKLKIGRELAAASDFASARTRRDLMSVALDADTGEAVAELVRRAVSQYHRRQN